MTDPYKNNAFAESGAGDSGGFSSNQSKLWRLGEHSYMLQLPDFDKSVSVWYKNVQRRTDDILYIIELSHFIEYEHNRYYNTLA